MTHRGPFQPLPFCHSVILCGKDGKAFGTSLFNLIVPAGEEVMVESHWKNHSLIYVHILDLHIYIKVYRAPVHRAKSSETPLADI